MWFGAVLRRAARYFPFLTADRQRDLRFLVQGLPQACYRYAAAGPSPALKLSPRELPRVYHLLPAVARASFPKHPVRH